MLIITPCEKYSICTVLNLWKQLRLTMLQELELIEARNELVKKQFLRIGQLIIDFSMERGEFVNYWSSSKAHCTIVSYNVLIIIRLSDPRLWNPGFANAKTRPAPFADRIVRQTNDVRGGVPAKHVHCNRFMRHADDVIFMLDTGHLCLLRWLPR